MKALPFTIPTTENATFHIQNDLQDQFYPYYHRHRELQVSWIRKGSGSFIAHSEFQSFSEGDVIILGSNVGHLFIKEESEAEIDVISLFFDVEQGSPLTGIHEMESVFDRFRGVGDFYIFDHGVSEEIKALLTHIYNDDSNRRLISYLSLLFIMSKHLPDSKTIVQTYSDEQGDIMDTIMRYTLDHYRQHISISDVASQVGYTKEAFCRFFKKRTRKTYMEYVIQMRIKEACRIMLSEPERPIYEIGFEVGFNNTTHFNRTFKKIMNCSPREYRIRFYNEVT